MCADFSKYFYVIQYGVVHIIDHQLSYRISVA